MEVESALCLVLERLQLINDSIRSSQFIARSEKRFTHRSLLGAYLEFCAAARSRFSVILIESDI